MNILYITYLSNNVDSGINWCVPYKIAAQEKVDNVYWVETNNANMAHFKDAHCFHKLSEFGPVLKLDSLPEPFSHPDVVFFEGMYKPTFPKIASLLRTEGIPYIVVPHGSLTYSAIHNHAWLKKRIAHVLIYDKYISKAAAIHYLTQKEYETSGNKWNQNHFIIPNGVVPPSITKKEYDKSTINAVFIGRLDIFHKGIDLILGACKNLSQFLRDSNFKLIIYGPKRYQYNEILHIIRESGISDFVSLGGAISGTEKENVLLNSNLFVLTSRFEGHPMGLIEAMSYGVPSIITYETNMGDEIQSYDAGWVCEEPTIESVTGTLKKVIIESSLSEKKGKNAIQLANQFNWDAIALKYRKEVLRVLGNK